MCWILAYRWRRIPAVLRFAVQANRSLVLAAALVGAAISFTGCQGDSDRVPVFKTRGKISFQNQPAGGAFVVLHPRLPQAVGDARPTAIVQPDGSFEATTFDSADGAPSGEYVVTVEWRKLVQIDGEWKPGPNLLPPKYESPGTSDIVVQVAEGENQLPEIVLR